MKYKLLPFLLLIHCTAFSQIAFSGSAQHIFAGSPHEYGGISDGNGGELTVNFHVKKTYFFGLGASAIKFDKLNNLYVPAYLDLKYAIPGKYSPFIVLQPGYGFFKGPQVELTDFNGNMVGTMNEKGGIYFAGEWETGSVLIRRSTCWWRSNIIFSKPHSMCRHHWAPTSPTQKAHFHSRWGSPLGRTRHQTKKPPRISQGLFKRNWNLMLSSNMSTKAGFSGIGYRLLHWNWIEQI